MLSADLISFRETQLQNFGDLENHVSNLSVSDTERQSVDIAQDALAEAIFLRAFTSYEFSLDAMFFHYVTGGSSLAGRPAETHLVTKDETIARKIVKNGNKFLSWAKPDQIREQSSTFIKNGWPIADVLSTRTQELADCERIRNRIAHNSTEAANLFNAVQRNLFSTERLFPISPGQLLRAKNKKYRQLHLTRYIHVLRETIITIIEPPTT